MTTAPMAGLASLPMYDRVETRAATDRLWQGIAAALAARGIQAPATLTRSGDIWADWLDPNLIFSQSCSLPYSTKLHGKVQIIAAPGYGIDCPAGMTYSVIVASTPELPKTPRIAVNDPLSQSGWGCFAPWLKRQGIVPAASFETGSHAASAKAVLDGQVDLAAIDAHTLYLMRRYDPWAADLVEIDRTPPTPCQPYIVGADQPAETMLTALKEGFAQMSQEDRQMLNLLEIVPIGPEPYRAVPKPAAPPGLSAL